MAEGDAAFVGVIPESYDRYLGPLLFAPYADDLAARLPGAPGIRVLETACGTGIVTERLVTRLAGRGTLVATDLSDAMLVHAQRRLPDAAGVAWRTADATALPFPPHSFDAVVCQFGLMFFPDKAEGIREAFRVLRPGGRFLFSVWDAMEENPAVRITHETVSGLFPADPPHFYRVPYGFHDAAEIHVLLRGAGFAGIACDRVDKVGASPSVQDAARGLIDGNPIALEILARRPDALGEVKEAVAKRLAAELGDRPLRSPLRALVFVARRPEAP